MERKHQREWVISELRAHGHVSNVNAFQHYILRLSSIIHRLRKEGWDIQTDKETNNTVYRLISEPCL